MVHIIYIIQCDGRLMPPQEKWYSQVMMNLVGYWLDNKNIYHLVPAFQFLIKLIHDKLKNLTAI